jgi:RHS repeat-associated protein
MNVASATRATFIPDIQGSFIGTLDAASGTLTKFGYQTYGESPSTTSSFRYTGQRIDPETGLYYYRGRMYSTVLGRFPQPDPIGYAGGSNLYAYVGNDPLNRFDPSGLSPDNPQASQNWSGTAVSWLQRSYNDVLAQPVKDISNLLKNPSEIPGAIASVAPGVTPIAAELPQAISGAVNAVSGLGTLLQTINRAPSAVPNMGDLTQAEINQIQSVVNEAGRPLEVVGSAARGSRGPSSDIDYIVPPNNLEYFEGLENRLPGIDPTHGIIPGVGNPSQGPIIRFEPQ